MPAIGAFRSLPPYQSLLIVEALFHSLQHSLAKGHRHRRRESRYHLQAGDGCYSSYHVVGIPRARGLIGYDTEKAWKYLVQVRLHDVLHGIEDDSNGFEASYQHGYVFECQRLHQQRCKLENKRITVPD